MSHLWFLIDLLIYSSILAVLLRLRWMPALARRADRVAGLMASRWWVAPGLLLFSGVAALGTVVALSVLGLNSTLHGMLVLARTSAHLPVFLCGAALALRRDWLDRFTRIHWWMWAAGLVLAAALAAVQWRDEDIYRAVTFFLMPVVGILFAHILMSGMRACFQGANRLVQIAVDSSFTVYLVHQVFIVFGVVLMMGSGIPVLLQFVLLVAASTILSLGFHQQLVRRRPVLRLLFNGVLPERAAPLAGAAAAPERDGYSTRSLNRRPQLVVAARLSLIRCVVSGGGGASSGRVAPGDPRRPPAPPAASRFRRTRQQGVLPGRLQLAPDPWARSAEAACRRRRLSPPARHSMPAIAPTRHSSTAHP
ncbi:acyltransferase family protein [Teichococcus aestuarii]|uniref:acyltransferase family protein n=1 Tax=Teichococcus aestuarii TaxID=568898 RepID=UPI0036185A4A